MKTRCGYAQSFLSLAMLLAATPVLAQPTTSGHLNVGAVSTNTGSQLNFVNGSVFVSSSGYIPMTLTSTGTYAGYFGAGPTLTALPGTLALGGPNASAPSLGSFIKIQMTLLSAPVGGAFSFWNSGATTPTYSLIVPDSLTPMWDLSGGTDNPTAGTTGADTFGHIHGRRFTATVPGEHRIAFQAFDTSLNGAQHAPSGLLEMRFVTVPEPSSIALVMLGGRMFAIVCFRRRSSASTSMTSHNYDD